jgi:hypothetical protein
MHGGGVRIKSLEMICLILVLPFTMNAQSLMGFNSNYSNDEQLLTISNKSIFSSYNFNQDDLINKKSRVLNASRKIGTISGSAIGILHMYWRATNVSGVKGPFWKSAVTGIPSIMIGSYIGKRTTEWMTNRIMRGNPKPFKAALKGAYYGAINGTLVLGSSFAPLLIMGHYTGSIDFNISKDFIIIKLIGASALGGLAYGGSFGAVFGIIYGPYISIYLNF